MAKARDREIIAAVCALLDEFGISANHHRGVADLPREALDWEGWAVAEEKIRFQDRPKVRAALGRIRTVCAQVHHLAPELSRAIVPVIEKMERKLAAEEKTERADVFGIKPRRGPRKTPEGRDRDYVIQALWWIWLECHGAPPAVQPTERKIAGDGNPEQPFVRMLRRLFEVWNSNGSLTGLQAAALKVDRRERKKLAERTALQPDLNSIRKS